MELALALLDVHVAADDGDDQLLVLLAGVVVDEGAHHEDCLGRLAGLDLQEGAKVVDRLGIGRRDLLDGLLRLCVVVLLEGGDLPVRRIAALGAVYDRVLSDGGQVHVLVADLASHHARIGADGDRRQRTA